MSIDTLSLEVKSAEEFAGRTPGSTTIIAVSKLQPLERVEMLLDARHEHFGENRVQEAMSKWVDLKTRYPAVTLHLLGPLQSNKVRQAMNLFQSIHSVDRRSLVIRIARIADSIGYCPELFIQVNTGEEPQKSGISPQDLDDLVSETRKHDLPLSGLMCIPPVNDEPALHFGLLGNLARRNGLEGLSMGMSSDFTTAIHLGATHVRVGTAIFGQRNDTLR